MKNKQIIKKNHEFQNIINLQKVIKNASFVIYFEPSENNYLRYGISVGKKLGNAVIRNKTKRQIRMMIQNLLKNSSITKYNIVIIARNRMLSNSFEKNEKEMNSLINKLNQYK